MIGNELGHIVHLLVDDDPRVVLGTVAGDILWKRRPLVNHHTRHKREISIPPLLRGQRKPRERGKAASRQAHSKAYRSSEGLIGHLGLNFAVFVTHLAQQMTSSSVPLSLSAHSLALCDSHSQGV